MYSRLRTANKLPSLEIFPQKRQAERPRKPQAQTKPQQRAAARGMLFPAGNVEPVELEGLRTAPGSTIITALTAQTP